MCSPLEIVEVSSKCEMAREAIKGLCVSYFEVLEDQRGEGPNK